jgi:hypothetical protein
MDQDTANKKPIYENGLGIPHMDLYQKINN